MSVVYTDEQKLKRLTAWREADKAEIELLRKMLRVDGIVWKESMRLLGLDASGTDIQAIPAAIKRLRAEKDAETDEFNAGYDAFMAGKSADAEPSAPRDMWLIGYAWAKYCRETGRAK